MVAQPYHYDPMSAPREIQMDSLRNGLLFPYLDSVEVFRCHAAKQKEEFRTYSLASSMNFPWQVLDQGERITNINQIRNSGNRMLFLCDYLFNWNASWYVPATADYWWNTTPIRHGAGGNVFSFMDGHAEYVNWKDQRTIALTRLAAEDPDPANRPNAANRPGNAIGQQADNEDLIWAARAVWGSLKKR